MNEIKKNRIHFHTFDSLRFLAFLLVFLSHSPIPRDSFLGYFTKSGGIGVVFFFVLSGFLITYILIIEKVNEGKINLRNFFQRRILRIWPLYYAMILFAFCTPYMLNYLQVPHSSQGYKPNWLMSLAFLENYKMMNTDSFPNVSPLIVIWTLCIEEHFYILWGLLLYFIPLKKIPHLIIVSISLSVICIIIYGVLGIPTLDIFTNIGYFAFGAIPAMIFVFYQKLIVKLHDIPRLIKLLYSVLILMVILLISNSVIILDAALISIILGALFSFLILLTLGEKNVLKISDNTWIAHLGKYTYGLYMIHTIVIVLFLKIGAKLDWNVYSITIVSLLITIILAFLSYHLFEKQFLKLKKKIN